jgi:hypothetical protein
MNLELEDQRMSEVLEDGDRSDMGTYRDSLAMAERHERKFRDWWASSLVEVEWSGASIITGVEIPIVGGLVGRALDYAIDLTVAMMDYPDAGLRWTGDTAAFLGAKVVAVVRRTPRDIEVVRFDPIPPRPAQHFVAGERAPPRCRIVRIDGSPRSTSSCQGIPLDGRELADTVDDAIRSLTEATPHHDPTDPSLDDVVLSYRAVFQGVVRYTTNGPAITRFDPPGPSSGTATDDGGLKRTGGARRRWRADPASAVSSPPPWPSRATR